MSEKFFKVCESAYGRATAIYHYINPNQIVSFHIEYGTQEVCVEAILTNDMRVILMKKDDVVSLIGDEEYLKLEEKMREYVEQRQR